MDQKSVERVWLRCENRIKETIVKKLHRSFNMFSLSVEDIMSEAMFSFFKNYYEKYEDDDQYLRFIFIVVKNKMCDLKKKEKRYYSTFKHFGQKLALSLGMVIKDDADHLEQQVGSQVRQNESLPITDDLLDNVIYEDYKKEIKSLLKDDDHRQVFTLMLDGYRQFEIGEVMGLMPYQVRAIKKNHIWPVVKKVMNISDEKYEYLICSGRIYA